MIVKCACYVWYYSVGQIKSMAEKEIICRWICGLWLGRTFTNTFEVSCEETGWDRAHQFSSGGMQPYQSVKSWHDQPLFILW